MRKIIFILITLIIIAAFTGVIFAQRSTVHQLRADIESLKRDILVLAFERQILTTNRQLKPAVSLQIAVAILECADLYELDPRLLFATMKQESHFNQQAIGSTGERGLMQIAKNTAGDIGLPWQEACDITANTCAGAAYLARHVHERGVLAGLLRYNGGGELRYPQYVLAHYPAMLERSNNGVVLSLLKTKAPRL